MAYNQRIVNGVKADAQIILNDMTLLECGGNAVTPTERWERVKRAAQRIVDQAQANA